MGLFQNSRASVVGREPTGSINRYIDDPERDPYCANAVGFGFSAKNTSDDACAVIRVGDPDFSAGAANFCEARLPGAVRQQPLLLPAGDGP